MVKQLTIQLFVCIGASIFWANVFAGSQAISTIEGTVARFIKSQFPDDSVVEISVHRLDQRLVLGKCDELLDAQWSPGSRTIGRVTVRVSCESPKPWQLHVQASVSLQSEVWVVNRRVNRGERLTSQMLSSESIKIGQGGRSRMPLGMPIEDPTDWIGHVFTRAAEPGRLLTDKLLELPDLVSRGDPVSIRYKSRNLSIQAKGTALGSGSLNQRISVRNKESGKVVEVTVVGQSRVTINR